MIPEKVEQFEWEPQNNRFALLTLDSKNQHNVNFYSIYLMKGNNRVSEVNCLCMFLPSSHNIDSLMNCPCNTLSWSPMGNYILLAGLGVFTFLFLSHCIDCFKRFLRIL